MEQGKMNKKWLKAIVVMLVTIFLMMAMGYAGSAMWSEAKALGVVCYLMIAFFGYLGVRTLIKINNE